MNPILQPPPPGPAAAPQGRRQRMPAFAALRRLLWQLVAYASFMIGVIALFIPGIPTTEFILLAAYAASKSSPRFYRWLEHNALFGPMLRNWRSHRSISRRIKIVATLSMSLCLVILALTVPQRWLVMAAAMSMSAGAWWLWSRPEKPVAATQA